MEWQVPFCLLLVFGVVCGQNIQEKTCSRSDNSVEIQPGSSALLGGIIALSEPGANGYGCGMPYGSMQAYESIRWVLDLLNKKDEFLQTEFLTNTYVPGVTLGMKVINNCFGRSASVAGIAQVYEGLTGDASECTKQNDKLVFGIVGGSSSDQANDMLQSLLPLDIPLISYEATAPQLTQSGNYPNFMRTVAPDSALTEVIVQVMIKMDWKYVAVVYDTGLYGQTAFSELHQRMLNEDLCLSAGIPVDGHDSSDGNMDLTLDKVLNTEATGVIFFGSPTLARALIERAGSNDRLPDTGRLQWIFADFSIESGMNIPYMRGMISVTLAYRFMVEFEDHWVRLNESNPSPENPWFQAWFAEKNDCSFTPAAGERNCHTINQGLTELQIETKRREAFQQDQFVEPAVMAVYTYAKALRNAHQDKCGGQSACPALFNMDRTEFYENYLKKVDFSFSSDERVPSLASNNVLPYNEAKHLSYSDQGDIKQPSFYVWNYNDIESGAETGNFKFKRIGTYINKFLELNSQLVSMYDNNRMNTLASIPNSHCPSNPCTSCVGLPSNFKYFYEPGDIIINGIFSLHEQGSQPMTCGKLRSTNKVMYMEAMIYALQSVNNDNSVLPNLKLGGLGIDDCSSQQVGQTVISQIQRGSLIITDSNQKAMNPNAIEAFTAAHTSPLTDPLAAMMNLLKHPMVGYRAGSVSLDDQTRYPYFIRSAPYIREEVRAIILLLKHQGQMYVQAVTSNSAYAREAYTLFRELAAREGICIVATHNLGDSDAAAREAVAGLALHVNSTATVALLENLDHHRLLQALHQNPNVRAGINLVASSEWATNTRITHGMENTAEGIISLSVQTSSLSLFQDYLRLLRAESHMQNPWFKEWFSHAYNCSLESDSTNGLQLCNFNQDINSGANFEVIHKVISIINGIKALARGLDKTLESYCGVGYTGICNRFQNSADKGMKFMEMLRAVTFQIEDMSPAVMFRFDGSAPVIPFNVNTFSGTNNKVGQINTEAQSVDLNAVLIPASSYTCAQPCLECMYVFNHQEFIHVPGDVMIGAVFNVHEAGANPFTCGDLRTPNGALYTEAFNFAVDKINQGSASVKLNVKLGYLGYDGCSTPTHTSAILNRVLSNNDVTVPDILSWVTYDSDITKDAALSLQKQGVPLVTPSSIESADLTKYTTLFRAFSSDAVIAKAMADFINSMGWKYVFSFNSPDESNREAARLFRQYLKDYGICVLSSYEFSTDGSMSVIFNSVHNQDSSNVVAVFSEPGSYIEELLTQEAFHSKHLTFVANRPWGPTAQKDVFAKVLSDMSSVFFSLPTVQDFIDYMGQFRDVTKSVNPWLDDIYEVFFSCDLPGSFTSQSDCNRVDSPLKNSNLFSEDPYVLSTINAVYSLAEAIHKTLVDKCGNDYLEVCPQFREDTNTRDLIMAYMDSEDFQDILNRLFKYIQREANSLYNLHSYSGTSTVLQGSVESGSLTLTDADSLRNSYTKVKSTCPDACQICEEEDANLNDFSLIPGDIYIVGIFDVHKNGNTPYTCGDVNDKHGAQLLDAFNFALDYVNRRQGIFSNFFLRLGGVGIDMCKSATRAGNLVANIQSGATKLEKNGFTVNPAQIDAYIGTMDTESSIRVADILEQLLIPQISYGATGMELLNQEKYSYFLRSVPADDKMGRAIISYLKKFELNNIQVIKSFDEIGEPGAAEFERLAEINLVCITKSYLVGGKKSLKEDAEDLMGEIDAHTKAKVLVLWMKNPLPVLEVLNQHPEIYNDTLIVATDKWGGDPMFLGLSTITNLLQKKNLIILDVESADVPGFDQYLSEKTPANYQTNPWFKEIFEMHQKCDWDAGTCESYRTIPRLVDYIQDPYVLYVVNAVFSAAQGIQKAVEELCTFQQQQALCSYYLQSGERKQKVLKHLKEVRFIDDTHQPFFYTPDGQSDRGFHFYNVTTKASSLMYENVGSYNDTDFLKLDITYGNDYDAKCDPRSNSSGDGCTCPLKVDLPTRFMKKADALRGLTLVYVGDIHKEDPDNVYGCGSINTGVDLYRMLAFFYAIDLINTNPESKLPESVRLDGLALDSCSNSLRLGQDVYNILSGNPLCDSDEEGQVVSPQSITAFITDKDHNAIPVSSILSPEGITSISPTATDSLLDDEFRHSTFLRMIGNNEDLNSVILQLADQLGWDMVGAIYTDTPVHKSAMDSLLREAKYRSRTMCVNQAVSLSLSATLDEAADALDQISLATGVSAVVLFVDPAHFRLLMESSKALGTPGLTWVVPTDWPTAEADIQAYKTELTGSIWIQSKTQILSGYVNYVKQLSLDNHLGLPDSWFQEIYETIHNCQILDLRERTARVYPNICSGNERITDSMIVKDPSIFYTILSVYATAFGLEDIPQCGVESDLDVAACLQKNDKYQLIHEGILGVELYDFSGLPEIQDFRFSFSTEGNGEGGYLITSRDENGALIRLGDYTTAGLNVNVSKLRETGFTNDGSVPTSQCAVGTSCHCFGPMGTTYRYSPALGPDWFTNPDTQQLVQVEGVPDTDDRFSEAWAIIIMVLAVLGAILALGMFMYLLVMYPVRGGTTILGYIISFGIILLYLMVFVFIAHASPEICAIRRFALGVVYAIVYSALLVKLIDCWRMRGKDEAKYNKLGRPLGFFFIVVFLVAVQVMINAEWLILEEPGMERVVYNKLYWPRCVPDDFSDEGLVLSLVYVMAMILLAFILGVWTFTMKTNHKESRWIFGIVVLSIPCWVVWCLVATLGPYRMRDAAVAIGLLVNATIMLLLMPIRKLFLLSKYNEMIEEEDAIMKEQYGDFQQQSVYGRQYDNRPQMMAGSVRGSAYDYGSVKY